MMGCAAPTAYYPSKQSQPQPSELPKPQPEKPDEISEEPLPEVQVHEPVKPAEKTSQAGNPPKKIGEGPR